VNLASLSDTIHKTNYISIYTSNKQSQNKIFKSIHGSIKKFKTFGHKLKNS
jgi:hypothetical protein